MDAPTENGCSFYVCGYITDGGSDRPFLTEVQRVDKTLAKRWEYEINAGFKYDPSNRRPITKFIPADDEDSHANLVIVCRNVDELRICLHAMAKVHVYQPSIIATTDGWPTAETANVTLRLYDGGTYAQAAAPKGSPPLPGLNAAKKLIEDEIRKLGGSNYY